MCLAGLGIKSCCSHIGSLMPSYDHCIVQREMLSEVLLKMIYLCTNKSLLSHIFALVFTSIALHLVAVVSDIGQHPVGYICNWKGRVVSIGA